MAELIASGGNTDWIPSSPAVTVYHLLATTKSNWPKASVRIEKKNSIALEQKKPITPARTAVTGMLSTNASANESPTFFMSNARAYAPTPKNVAWPNDRSPVYPKSTLKLSANSAPIRKRFTSCT